MKPARTYKTLHSWDPDLEMHVVLLLARMACDLRVLLYEPPDLSTPEAAARTTVLADRLLETIESHHRVLRALRYQPQERVRR
jgi:hypothetical protein